MILTCEEMLRAEEAAFARGIEAEALMDQAGAGIADAIRRFFPNPGALIIFAGKGHNGGDAFVCARHLIDHGWAVHVRLTHDASDLKELARAKLNAIRESARVPADGLRRPPTGAPARLARWVARHRR